MTPDRRTTDDKAHVSVQVGTPDPLHEYRISKLEEAVAALSTGFGDLITEIQRAKWVLGGALLVSQGKDILSLLNQIHNITG